MALEYDTITDFSYNSFTDTCTNIPVGYAGCACEEQSIPAGPPYIISTYHAPVANTPSYTDIYIGAVQLTEVAKTSCPANNQYRVNYEEKGRGQIEFHANQASCNTCMCYCHVGTLVSKDALDVRLNVYCGVNCALCAYASSTKAVYGCANAFYGGYFETAGSNGLYGGSAGSFGGVFCANVNYGLCATATGSYGGCFVAGVNIGVSGTSACDYGGLFCAGRDYGMRATATNNYGIAGIAAGYRGVYGCAGINYGVCGEAVCFGVIGVATANQGIYGCAVCCGAYGCATTNYGVYGSAVCIGVIGVASANCGVQGCAAGNHGGWFCSGGDYGVYSYTDGCYGACGHATTSRPVSGNGAYYDSTSNRNIKVNKENISILECFGAHPNFKIQKWQYADTNQKGFDHFIGPYAEDIKCVFDLTFDNTGIYQLDGIALGATVELYRRLVALEKEVNILKIGNINLSKEGG